MMQVLSVGTIILTVTLHVPDGTDTLINAIPILLIQYFHLQQNLGNYALRLSLAAQFIYPGGKQAHHFLLNIPVVGT